MNDQDLHPLLAQPADMAINLKAVRFSAAEACLFATQSLSVSVFHYPSGVNAVRLSTQHGNMVVLPFQGQQIWSASLSGRAVGMRSMFRMPYPTTRFLETYGGFFQHCGGTYLGAPPTQDRYGLHGELPNAPYEDATLLIGSDERGAYIGLTGVYRHIVAFSVNYEARPLLRFYCDRPIFDVGISVVNRMRKPLDLAYLAHLNWRPVDNARIKGTTPCTPEEMRVRLEVPSHIQPEPGYLEFIERLAKEPDLANVLSPELAFDPEVVFAIGSPADETGHARFRQCHPNGETDYIAFRPAEFGDCARWICRTADQDALGLALPIRKGLPLKYEEEFLASFQAGTQVTCDTNSG